MDFCILAWFSKVDAGCEMTKMFSIQFCFSLLAFSTVLEKMRAKVMEPMMKRVEKYRNAFEEDSQKQYGVDERFRNVANGFYNKSRTIVKECKEKIDKLASQWWVCTIGALFALFVMISGLYITRWWFILLTLLPLLYYLGFSWWYSHSAKKSIDQQKEGIKTAWEGHCKKTEDTEDDVLQKLSESP